MNLTKVTGEYYARHLKKELLPECARLYPENNIIFAQDWATTSNVYQGTLQRLCFMSFVKKDQWPPKSPDCNILDYYFWDNLSREVYKDRREPFENIEQL